MTVMKGNCRIVEQLVGCGASLSIADCDGDTPLHLLLIKMDVDKDFTDTPELKKVIQFLHYIHTKSYVHHLYSFRSKKVLARKQVLVPVLLWPAFLFKRGLISTL